jgi:hypothetical protein
MMTAIAWPSAAVVIALTFLLLFRANLGRAIDRAQKVGVGKTSVDMAEAQQQLATSQHARPTAMESMAQLTESAFFTATRNELLQDLDQRGLVGDEHTRFLTEVVVTFAVKLELEKTYRRILGSQIAALRYVAQSPAGVETTELQPFYDAVKQTLMQGHPYTFNNWLTYLVENSALLTMDGPRVYATPKGRDFLKYAVDEALWLDKGL